ncbi:3'-5' exonuclease [Streptomyces sp. NPDC056441]|uniref:3'-5' exonuclease n=1 Tax=Streptomyces sp. NPDC056441 TaxID=3345817 RepID=UPI00368900A0
MRFVRPEDTERPTWAAYEHGRYLGTFHARTDSDGLCHVQTVAERHTTLDDAVRALRRPPSWRQDRARVAHWARGALNDPALLLIDVQTTGLGRAWAVQIAAMDRTGRTLLNELLNPSHPITHTASRLHGITTSRVTHAPTFAELLPALTGILLGRRCLAYNIRFDHGVLTRELLRHHRDPSVVRAWLEACRWEDAMRPAAVSKGLWSANRKTYRNQRLGGSYDAEAKCHALLRSLQHLASHG